MITGEKVRLGPILQPDAPIIFNWHDNVSVMHRHGPYSPLSQRSFDEWLNNIGRDPPSVVFSIRKKYNLVS